MKLRLNWRLVFVLVILAGFATREVALELRPVIPAARSASFRVRWQLRGRHAHSDRSRQTRAIRNDRGWAGAQRRPRTSHAQGNLGAQFGGGYAWILDVKSNQIVAHIPVGAEPYALDFSPDGKRAFVAASGANAVVAIDCASRAIVARGRAGRRPWIARVTPDGKVLIVSNRDDSTISLLDANSLASLGTISVAS